MQKTAAIIIIGNEILSGKVHDTNSHYLAAELRGLGVDVRRVLVIPDEAEVIAREVAAASAAYDYVFTAGGVGPTHDDVTMQGIARAFNLRTVVNEKILDVIMQRCRSERTEPFLKMAEVPEGAEVIETEGLRFPPVVVRNVYVFPGIPDFLRQKFALLKERFRSRPFLLRKIYLNEEECFIAHHLEQVIGEFPDVAVGSYPKVNLPEYKVMVTLESREADVLERAFRMLLDVLPKEYVVKTE